MNIKFEKLLADLQHATDYQVMRSRSSIGEAIFYLFSHATNHTIARILSLHNTEILEILRTWQAQMGGLKDKDIPKNQVQISHQLDSRNIDNIGLGRNLIAIEVLSVFSAYNTISEQVGLDRLISDLQKTWPDQQFAIKPSEIPGNFILELL